MLVNNNLYKYSYANAIGCALKLPLYKLISNLAIAATGKTL